MDTQIPEMAFRGEQRMIPLLLTGMILVTFSVTREDVQRMKSGQPGLLDLAWTLFVSCEIGFLVIGTFVLVLQLWTLMK